MPAGDRTGPFGYGSMTGRGAGYCTGQGAPGYVSGGFGYGSSRGYGGGRGRRRQFYTTGAPGWARGYDWYGYTGPAPYGGFTPESEMEMLRGQAESLKRQMDVLNSRMSELQEIASKKGEAKE